MSEFQPIGLQHKPFIDEALAWEGSKSSSDSCENEATETVNAGASAV